mmetsp:Transcript_23977/g.54566  ORF Transcript_23977/g.54566 Transcript_23977/m.54566 type:complete len:86 (-) Transcript_23977:401-658(-)
MRRVIGTNGLDTMLMYVDAALANHPNMRSCIGGLMPFGKGAIHARSSKQKIKTKSSTESELVGTKDYISWTIWLMGGYLSVNDMG